MNEIHLILYAVESQHLSIIHSPNTCTQVMK